MSRKQLRNAGNKNVRKKNDRNEVKITKTEIKNNETVV